MWIVVLPRNSVKYVRDYSIMVGLLLVWIS
jgi:hypothetical protein